MAAFTVRVARWEVHGVLSRTVVLLNLAGLVHMRLSEFLQMLRGAWNIHVNILSYTIVC